MPASIYTSVIWFGSGPGLGIRRAYIAPWVARFDPTPQLGTGAKMNHYGISAIHWNADLGEIDEVLLHKLVRHEREGTFVFEPGEPTWCSDVVRLIRGGDMVWVIQDAGRDSYKNTDHVGINAKRGQQAYLYSCTRDGTPTPALTDLPRYQKPDDAPRGPLGVGRPVDRAAP